MPQPIIEVKNISKLYHLGLIGATTFRESAERWWRGLLGAQENSRFFGKNKPMISPDNPQAGPKPNTLWALKDVSFSISQGEIVGIIGRNGAGKSTLLKILSRITEPTSGYAILRGSISSLLEVGTGFHPELTGRENIYLNGAILGMRKPEIKRKFDEIVAFAEIENFIDTPVKRYSSGMYMRLAFAVAAHLEPEVLLIDEVLAVGDAAFQKKCLGKMKEVSIKEGKTVLFVSHNMAAISALCKKAIVLQRGKIVHNGGVKEAIGIYNDTLSLKAKTEWIGEAGEENIKLYHTWVASLDPNGDFHTAAALEIGIEVEVLRPIDGLILGFTLLSEYSYELAYTLFDDPKDPPCEIVTPGKYTKKFIIPANTLAHGSYQIEFDVGIHMVKEIIGTEGRLSFSLDNICGIGRRFTTPSVKGRVGLFRPRWSIE